MIRVSWYFKMYWSWIILTSTNEYLLDWGLGLVVKGTDCNVHIIWECGACVCRGSSDYTRDYYSSSARGNGSHDGSAAELNQSMQNIMTGSNVQDNLQSLVDSIKKVRVDIIRQTCSERPTSDEKPTSDERPFTNHFYIRTSNERPPVI